ncbi:MAG TPA: SRPBCC domain-containing protein [Gemmatimonadaceae bacterium]|jgi:uncharacterized protein YndB with AHSA1/START domain
MATAAKKEERAEATLEIRRTIPAPRERVFEAWTQAKELDRWSAPSPMTPTAEVDLRVGGRYRIVMRGPDGAEHRVGGVYRTIDRPSRLVYTWKWEDSPMPDSVVTVEFHERGKETEVVLRHEGLTDSESRGRHEHGWNACLDNLVTIMTR